MKVDGQRTQVAERIDRLQQLSAGLDRMIDAHERGLLLTIEQQAAIFGPQWNPDWPAQARQRYGDTTQWLQYAERSASRGPEEWQAIADAVASDASARPQHRPRHRDLAVERGSGRGDPGKESAAGRAHSGVTAMPGSVR